MRITIENAEEIFDAHLRKWYNISLSDVEITKVEGFWRMKNVCDENCRDPIHMHPGHEKRTRHPIPYKPILIDENGERRPTYEVWEVLSEKKEEPE